RRAGAWTILSAVSSCTSKRRDDAGGGDFADATIRVSHVNRAVGPNCEGIWIGESRRAARSIRKARNGRLPGKRSDYSGWSDLTDGVIPRVRDVHVAGLELIDGQTVR